MAAKKLPQQKTTILAKILGSNWFFAGIIAFFLFQTIWIALSAIYPMLFDEEYHLGIIDIYSRQLLPFIHLQPPEASFHGDITRYGSYMFHYLMSFPYRLIQIFGADLQTTIITLRIICISFVVAGLFVFRAFLLRAGLTKSLTNLSIATSTMIPIVPFALAQINYDSLAFLLVATIFYISIRAVENTKNQAIWIILLLATSSIASLVKFTILPIAFVNVLFVLIVLWRKYKSKLPARLFNQTKNLSKLTIICSVLFLLLAVGLFVERYGTNIIQYRTIEPKCDRLHSDESCIQYTVWRRDTTWHQENLESGKKRNNPLEYTYISWVPDVYTDFTGVAAFTYDDPNQALQIRYLPTAIKWSPGTPIMRIASWAVLVLAILALIFSWRKLPNRRLRYLTIGTLGVFIVSMWVRNYTDYMYIGTVTATQGRYFIPILIPIIAVVGLAFRHYLTRMRYQTLFLLACVLIFMQGGGVMNYMLYSSPQWYWLDGRQAITTANESANTFLRLFTIP